MKKINCPYHDDANPSMHVYEEYAHCFVCGAHARNDKIGVKGDVQVKKRPTDIKGVMEYIRGLPIERIRGLDFPTDNKGYYIVWPTNDFYKRRNTSGDLRYSGPRGARPPLFLYQGSKRLIVVEGEINVCTIHTIVRPDHTICSPGSASEFKRHIKEYMKYDEITLILDHDAAGIVFGLEIKEMLLKTGKRTRLVTVRTDYNDVLQEQGPEAVKLQFERDMKW